MLFLKYSTRGDYSQFAKIIENLNGRLLSLENPHYIRANLKLEQDYVDEFVHNDELEIAPHEFDELVNRFIAGSHITV